MQAQWSLRITSEGYMSLGQTVKGSTYCMCFVASCTKHVELATAGSWRYQEQLPILFFSDVQSSLQDLLLFFCKSLRWLPALQPLQSLS